MKPTAKTLTVSLCLGLFLWLIDALVDRFIFHNGSFLDLLILDIPSRTLYTRVIILNCFIIFGFVSGHFLSRQKKTALKLADSLEFQQQLINSIPVPIFYKDLNYLYTGCNKSFADFFGFSQDDLIRKDIDDLIPKEIADIYQETDSKLPSKSRMQMYELETHHISKGRRNVSFHTATVHNSDGQVTGQIGTMLDITEQTEAEKKKETLTIELQEALDKVKTLSGFLPICTSCHNVRDDHGFGSQIENYIQKNPQTELSQHICSSCMRKLYPDFADDMDDK